VKPLFIEQLNINQLRRLIKDFPKREFPTVRSGRNYQHNSEEVLQYVTSLSPPYKEPALIESDYIGWLIKTVIADYHSAYGYFWLKAQGVYNLLVQYECFLLDRLKTGRIDRYLKLIGLDFEHSTGWDFKIIFVMRTYLE
jgi:hypothetical protein